MGKIAFIFPGQGAQYPGMAEDFCAQRQESRLVLDLAEQVSGLDMKKLLFDREDQRLNETAYTQIALLTAELAIAEAVKACGVRPDITAGLSLGEYAALVTAGVFSMADALRIVRKRGIFMQEAVPTGGAMAAVLGLDGAVIADICEKTPGIVSIANDNCPGQIVITGEAAAVEAACEALKAAGAKRCIPLKVSGPFHGKLMEPAGEQLEQELLQAQVGEIQLPFVSNVTADFVTDKDEIRGLLKRQISSSVRWRQSMERIIADGADLFLELGPGKTLSGFLRKIDRNVKVLNVETIQDLEKLTEVREWNRK